MAKIIDLFRQILQGKTIYRILFNQQVKSKCANLPGKTIDLAGGGKGSYYRYLPSQVDITKTNYLSGVDIDQVVDLNLTLPFTDQSFDGVLLFNALYIMKNPTFTLSEINRILKPGGVLYLSSPFIANEMPEPHDYYRFTAEGLTLLFNQAGFTDFYIDRFGERFSSVVYILHNFWLFNLVRLIIYPLALLGDKLIPKKLTSKYPLPLGYFCVVKK